MDRTVVPLGGFYTARTALVCNGKRFADAGLQDILIESEVVASGSINGVKNGHRYNGNIHSHSHNLKKSHL